MESSSTGEDQDERKSSPVVDTLAPKVSSSPRRSTHSPVDEGTTLSSNAPIAVILPSIQRPWDYQLYEDDVIVDQVLEDIIGQYEVKYIVRFADGQEQTVSIVDHHDTRSQPLFLTLHSGVSVALENPFQRTSSSHTI